jgi:hypothetical protein
VDASVSMYVHLPFFNLSYGLLCYLVSVNM